MQVLIKTASCEIIFTTFGFSILIVTMNWIFEATNHCCELENVGLVYFLQELRYCILRVTRARSLFWLIWVYISLHFLPFLFKNYFFVFLGFLQFLCFEFDVIFLDFIYSLCIITVYTGTL